MIEIDQDGAYFKTHHRRFLNTLEFMNGLDLKGKKILNLGPDNPFSHMLINEGYDITNTNVGQDLDLDFEVVSDPTYEVVVGFEILEHMVSPFPLLKAIAGKQLVITVPLSMWFTKAYWNDHDPYDCHYHEFEAKQVKMLLEKAGWSIKKDEKHIAPIKKIGIRPFLRTITPRHYFVYAERP
ncbi:MAG: methyltransferase [Cytophagales bacterium]|nr:methyltransferase [Cytophagales bacterium]